MTRSLPDLSKYAAFFVGLAAVCWVGMGYIGTNPLALLISLLIGAFYVMGALELRRYQQATGTLAQAVAERPAAPASLGAWLEPLHPSLRNAVRLRVEGERIGLPGPALTPYLAGLLVLLGMLGTFLGMMVTLNGTGSALESATDLQAVRASLSAPVKGLGLAFGTSLAGVAASAMLGLISALCRRDRLQTAQLLDTRIATVLRPFSLAHQRDESFRLLQAQGEAMPVLVDRLQAMMGAMERQAQALNEQLIGNQQSFHDKTEAAYAGLATSVDRSLKESVTDSARLASTAIQPVVEATMAGIARETAALHDTVGQSMQRQLDGLSSRLEAGTTTVAGLWKSALAGHQQSSEALALDLRDTLGRFTDTFEQRSAALVDGVSSRLEQTVGSMSEHWQSALAQHERASQSLSGDTQRALVAASATFEQHAAALLRTVDSTHAELQAGMAAGDQQRLAAWTAALETMAASLQQQWLQTGERSERQQQAICDTLVKSATEIAAQTEAQARSTLAEIGQLVQAASEAPRALTAASAAFEQHAASLLRTVDSAHAELHSGLAASDQQRLAAWTASLEAMAASLQQQWLQTGEHSARQQQAICDTLAQTAAEISSQSEAHTRNTIAEIGQLVQAASEAPRALTAASAAFEQHAASLLRTVDAAHTELQAGLAAGDEQRLATWTASLQAMAASLDQQWQQTGERSERQQQAICDTLVQTATEISAQTAAHTKSTIAEIGQLVQAASEAPRALTAASAAFEQHAASLLRTVDTAHTELQTGLAASDQQRLTAWTAALEAMATSLQQQWQQTGEHSERQQQAICDTLAQTATEISAQTEAHTKSTIAEIGQLVQLASEAPRAAAEVMTELRQKLSEGMARDNSMLEERSRILGTLETLLEAVNHASTEQRGAIDALVSTSADLLDRVGARFTDQVDSEAGKMAEVAAQITGSAVEVASLGEAFGFAVQLFSESNDKLGAQLQRIEAALGKSLTRSDEQLAYYVAQAREVIDLSILSQKQIVEDLQQIAGQRMAAGSEA
ncbi:DUF802 domain-containing protein [Variovorax boronicumulans]|uniref:DUF802 domain-containing protein n=1 Tax=Variovorax boronicumulans TaxID=436515 RepID=UPI001C55BBD0